jgi:hypothetical protein
MMSCKLNHNLICLGFGHLSKGLGTNLKFVTNKNVQFHWPLLLGPLSKVALNPLSTQPWASSIVQSQWGSLLNL